MKGIIKITEVYIFGAREKKGITKKMSLTVVNQTMCDKQNRMS